jgi:hypothetical protein
MPGDVHILRDTFTPDNDDWQPLTFNDARADSTGTDPA